MLHPCPDYLPSQNTSRNATRTTLENATNGISSASADAVRRTNVALARATLGIQELLCAAVKAEGGANPGIVKVS